LHILQVESKHFLCTELLYLQFVFCCFASHIPPSPTKLAVFLRHTLLDRNGQVLIRQRINKQQHRFDWTPLNEVSPALLDALLFVEDKDFYRHHGVDWGAVSRSAVNYLTGQKARGASTLTMQLTALLNNDLSWQRGGRTLSRKWQQLQAAKQLEKTWTKNQILEAYLNLTMWRGDLQGISTASLALFGKWPRGLNRNESILLVSLLNAPNASEQQSSTTSLCAN
jgi:penicillin-binding protein 1C